MSLEEVALNVSSIRTLDDCPDLIVHMEPEFMETKKRINLNFTLTTPLDPYGVCCKAEYFREQKSYALRAILLKKSLKSSSLIDGYEMYLSSKESASIIERNGYNIEGSSLKTVKKSEGNGYKKIYHVKVKEEIHLENDPQFACRKYRDIKYDKVREEH